MVTTTVPAVVIIVFNVLGLHEFLSRNVQYGYSNFIQAFFCFVVHGANVIVFVNVKAFLLHDIDHGASDCDLDFQSGVLRFFVGWISLIMFATTAADAALAIFLQGFKRLVRDDQRQWVLKATATCTGTTATVILVTCRRSRTCPGVLRDLS